MKLVRITRPAGDGGDDVVLTVGPLSGDVDQAFRKRVQRYLSDPPNR